MKTPSALAFALLALVMIAAAPAPTGIAPALALPGLAPADPTRIGEPAPLPKINPCFEQCLEIREWCDAGCSTSQCHRECRDSAVECISHC
ncbi:MAG TPA: hypothetical protein VN493_24155 [Thermoanaerobaculia bacterium]|nr:hypothetical protein [Thermoanaerobaculia bacterium]